MLKKLGTFKDFSDNSLKTVFENDDKQIIEMTLLANKETMDVVCVPTHHFCNLGCKMCHLTNKGLNKAMVPIKIGDFVDALFQTVRVNDKRRTNKDKLLISFMGVGEPLLNLKLIEDVYRFEETVKKAVENIKPKQVVENATNNNSKLGKIAAFTGGVSVAALGFGGWYFSKASKLIKEANKLVAEKANTATTSIPSSTMTQPATTTNNEQSNLLDKIKKSA